jgi:hypothetical protein
MAKLSLQIVIGGLTTSLEFNPKQPLHAVIAEALGKTGNSGRRPGEWLATNQAGDPLDTGKTLEELGIVSGMRLFLSPGAGAGG